MAGCGGCGKRAAKNAVASSNSVVYQATDSSGKIVSEHSSHMDARSAAAAVGGRVRVTRKPIADVVS